LDEVSFILASKSFTQRPLFETNKVKMQSPHYYFAVPIKPKAFVNVNAIGIGRDNHILPE
jgi:hypothetical protein